MAVQTQPVYEEEKQIPRSGATVPQHPRNTDANGFSIQILSIHPQPRFPTRRSKTYQNSFRRLPYPKQTAHRLQTRASRMENRTEPEAVEQRQATVRARFIPQLASTADYIIPKPQSQTLILPIPQRHRATQRRHHRSAKGAQNRRAFHPSGNRGDENMYPPRTNASFHFRYFLRRNSECRNP